MQALVSYSLGGLRDMVPEGGPEFLYANTDPRERAL